MRSLWIVGLIGSAALIACSDDPYDPDAPAIDPRAPRVHITSPARGTFAGDVTTLVVTGTASDDTGVTSVEVNGVSAALGTDGTWQATVPVRPGTQLLHAVARDAGDNVGKESRAVVTGPLSPIDAPVPDAITAAMSAQTFDAISRGITGFLRTGNLEAVIAPLNPVIDLGGGPGCNYAQAAISKLTVGDATTVSLTPTVGGVRVEAELDQVSMGMHLSYAVLCVDGARDITVAARHAKVAGLLRAGVSRGAFDFQLVDPDVQISGVEVDLGGVPGEIVELLNLESALGPIMGWVAERVVVPMLNSTLASLDETRTVDVLGTPVDLRVKPARIRFDGSGALIELDTTLRAQGDAASPGYVYLANQTPAMATQRGFELAVADDAVNQLLGSLWAARGFEKTFDLTTGSYGELGQLYDRVELSVQVPPFVHASDGALELALGDLTATFKAGEAIATQVTVSAEIEVKVVAGPEGRLRLDVGAPTTYVDVLDENVGGANALSNAQFELITSFALARLISVASGAVGAIPLPSFGGVSVRDLSITEQTGYLVIDGDVQ